MLGGANSRDITLNRQVGAVLVNIPYTLLIMNFDYPDILRESTGHILTRYQEGGTGLIFTWLAFAWVGLKEAASRLPDL